MLALISALVLSGGSEPTSRVGPYVGVGLAVGATISDGASRYGTDGFLAKGRLDAELGLGLTERLTLGLSVHYTPHFNAEFLSAQGFGVPLTGFLWRGLYLRVTPGVDWVPIGVDEPGLVIAPGGIVAGGWEWRVGRRVGVAFDVGLDLRGVSTGDPSFLVGGFNRVRVTFY